MQVSMSGYFEALEAHNDAHTPAEEKKQAPNPSKGLQRLVAAKISEGER